MNSDNQAQPQPQSNSAYAPTSGRTKRQKSPQKAKKLYPVLITTGLLAALILFYSFLYIPNRKEEIHERNFRIINKLGDNVEQRLISSRRNAKHIARTAFKDCRILKELNKEAGHFNRYIRFTKPCTEEVKWLSDSLSVFKTNGAQSKIRIWARDTLYDSKKRYYQFELDAQKMLDDLMAFDHFERFAIISPDEMVYTSEPLGLRVIEYDSLANIQYGLTAGSVRMVHLGGVDYELYARPIPHVMGSSQTWYLLGLIKNDVVQKQAMKVRSHITITFLLGACLLLLLLPVIRLALMGTFEHLDRNDLLLSGLSLLAIALLITLTINYIYSYQFLDKPRMEQHLKTISGQIEKGFRQELESGIFLLSNVKDSVIDKNSGKQGKRIAHLIDSLNIFYGQVDPNRVVDLVRNVVLFDLFWIDSTGQQTQKFSLGEHVTPIINVGFRDYFKEIRYGNGWRYNNLGLGVEYLRFLSFLYKFEEEHGKSQKISNRIYLQSIVSTNTGEKQVVLTLDSDPESYHETIVGLSARFPSLIDNLLPEYYRFAVVNNRGELLFHSQEDRNLQENFIEEVKDGRAVMEYARSGIGDAISTEYHNRAVLMRAQQLAGLPLYLVVYKDLWINGYKQILVLFVTLIVPLLLFVMALLTALGFAFQKYRGSGSRKHLRYDWLMPDDDEDKKRIYVKILYGSLGGNLVLATLLALPDLSSINWLGATFIAGYEIVSLVIIGSLYSETTKDRFSGKQLYCFAAASIILLLAVTGPTLLYRYNYEAASRLVRHHIDIKTHQALMERNQKIYNRFARLESAVKDSKYRKKIAIIRKWSLQGGLFHYGNIELDSKFSNKGPTKHSEHPWYFNSIITAINSSVKSDNLVTVPMDQHAATGTASYWGYADAPHDIAFRAGVSGPGTLTGQLKIDYDAESYLDRLGNSPLHYLMLILAIVVALASIWYLLRYTIYRLFIFQKPDYHHLPDLWPDLNRETRSRSLNNIISLLPDQTVAKIKEKGIPTTEIRGWESDLQEVIKAIGKTDPSRTIIWHPRNLLKHSDAVIQILQALQEHQGPVVLVTTRTMPEWYRLLREQQGREVADRFLEQLPEIRTYYDDQIWDALADAPVLTAQIGMKQIWRSLSLEERFMCFDLAEDGVANLKNTAALQSLISKGVFCCDTSNRPEHEGEAWVSKFTFTENSFSDFIQTHVDTTELKELADELNEGSSWQTFRLPVILLLLTVTVFFLVSNQGDVNRVLAIITPILGAIPVLFRFSESILGGRQTPIDTTS